MQIILHMLASINSTFSYHSIPVLLMVETPVAFTNAGCQIFCVVAGLTYPRRQNPIPTADSVPGLWITSGCWTRANCMDHLGVRVDDELWDQSSLDFLLDKGLDLITNFHRETVFLQSGIQGAVECTYRFLRSWHSSQSRSHHLCHGKVIMEPHTFQRVLTPCLLDVLPCHSRWMSSQPLDWGKGTALSSKRLHTWPSQRVTCDLFHQNARVVGVSHNTCCMPLQLVDHVLLLHKAARIIFPSHQRKCVAWNFLKTGKVHVHELEMH